MEFLLEQLGLDRPINAGSDIGKGDLEEGSGELFDGDFPGAVVIERLGHVPSFSLGRGRTFQRSDSRAISGQRLPQRRLGLHELLESLIEPGREEVAWADVAAVLTVGKFCGQASELGIAESWYARTALEDIAGIPAEAVNDDRLYRALDKVGAHKDRLCEHLMERYRSWFGVDFEFLLYDVTSTYFEGLAEGNEKAARGYSRDHRGDCKQVCIGLVCTPEGLPLNFEVFAGNRTDVTTVGDMVRKMEERFGKAERVWVMDRGMVSEGNISLLSERKALYLVGTPKSHLRAYEAELVRDEEGRAIALELSCPVKEGEHPTLAKGAYLLRTNCTETDPAKLWRWYMQLTQAEAAFRTAKSDIGLRPVYHQKTERVEAHLLVCFLSLALWRTLEMWMNGKGLGSSARKLVEAVGTIRSMDLSVPVRRGNRTVKLNLRTVAKPDPDVALLLAHLGLRLPKGSRLVENVVEKTTP